MKMEKRYWYWHPWHNTIVADMMAVDGAEQRRFDIKTSKPNEELALRFRLFKKAVLPASVARWLENGGYHLLRGDIRLLQRYASKEAKLLLRLHKQQCPRCPWGRGIGEYKGEACIFTRRKKNGEWY